MEKTLNQTKPAVLSGINLWLAGSIGFSFVLLGYRVYLTQQSTYLFLVWNLFLAGIPYLFSSYVYHQSFAHKPLWKHLPLLLLWLLFLPNAPYILTDLFHLQQRPLIPKWYDLMLLLSFALNGLVLGVVSIFQVHDIIDQNLGRISGFFFSLFICLVSAFGVYLGRFLRFNSWDVISNPSPLLEALGAKFSNPFAHGRTFGMTLVMGFMLFLFYSLLRSFRNNQ